MAVADDEVEVSRWEHAATRPAVPILRRALEHFARSCGMDPLALDALSLALGEVIAHGVSTAADDGDDRIVVDAAADREWISVWVTYGRSDVDDTVFALATLFADRVETAVLAPGERTRVILEFPLVPVGPLLGAWALPTRVRAAG